MIEAKTRRSVLEELEARALLSAVPCSPSFEPPSDSVAQFAEPFESLDESSALVDESVFNSEVISAEASSSATWIVDSVSDSATVEGSLRRALLNAKDGDVVRFSPALKGKTIVLSGSELVVDKLIVIDATDLWDETGDAPGLTIDANGASRAFLIRNSCAISGLTVTGGRADEGAGIYVANGGKAFALDKCRVVGNRAYGVGGGLLSLYNRLLISDCVFKDNVASNDSNDSLKGRGGAIYYAGSLVVQNSAFVDNSSAVDGGAIYTYCAGDLTIQACAFEGNASKWGGALFSLFDASVVDSRFADNSASSCGGAVYSYGDSSYKNCEFVANSAYWAGAFYSDCNDDKIVGCRFVDNVASEGGGAIEGGCAPLEIVDSDLLSNSAMMGGAIYYRGSKLILTNCEISRNTASSGGGAYVRFEEEFRAANCVISENSGDYVGAGFDLAFEDVDGDGTIANFVGSATNCVFSRNVCDSASCTYGGALYVCADVRFDDCLFQENSALIGGGIYALLGTFARCKFVGNVAKTDGNLWWFSGYGGGAAALYGETSFVDCSFEDNEAGLGAAVRVCGNSNADFVDCLFDNNRATDSGGAFYCDETSVARLVNCALVDNSCSEGSGGAIFTAGEVALDNSILLFNASPDAGEIAKDSAGTVRARRLLAVSFEMVEVASNEDFFFYDANLPLFLDPDARDYSLAPGSQAIDKGNDALVSVETDLAGAPRFQNAVDLGPYEYRSEIPTLDPPTLAVSSVSETEIALEFGTVDGADAYLLEYSTDQSFENSTLVRLAAPGATSIAALEPETTYRFRIRAVAETRLDSEPTLIVATTLYEESDVLDCPFVSLFGATSSEIIVSVVEVPNATGCRIEWGTDPSFASFAVVETQFGLTTFADLTPGSTYYFRVFATADDREDSAPTWFDATTPDVAPPLDTPGVSLLDATVSSLAIQLAPVLGATVYVVQYSASPNFASFGSAHFSSSGDKTIAGLPSDSTIYLRVKATAPGRNDSDWATLQARTLAPLGVLSSPTLVAARATLTSLDLAIGEVEFAEEYVLEYSLDPNFATRWTRRRTSPGVETLANLPSGTDVYVRVKATVPDREDSPWTTATFATQSEERYLAPPEVRSIESTKSSIAFQIVAPANGSEFVVAYGTDPTFADASVATFSGLGVKTISELSFETLYYFRVKATAQTRDDSEWTPFEAQTLPEFQILTPPNVSLESVGDASVSFRLEPTDGANSYLLYYGLDPNFATYSRKNYSSTGTKTISGLATGSVYYFQIKAIGAGYADSPWTRFCAKPGAEIQPLAPPTLELVSVGELEIVLNVGAVPGADRLVLEYGSDPNFEFCSRRFLYESGETTLDLPYSETKYYVRAKAVARGCDDSVWRQISATTGAFELDRLLVELGNDAQLPTPDDSASRLAYYWNLSGKPDDALEDYELAPDNLVLVAPTTTGERRARTLARDPSGAFGPSKEIVLQVVESNPALKVDVETAAEGSAAILNLETARNGSLIARWEIDWGDGATSTCDRLGTSLVASHFYDDDSLAPARLATIRLYDPDGRPFDHLTIAIPNDRVPEETPAPTLDPDSPVPTESAESSDANLLFQFPLEDDSDEFWSLLARSATPRD